MLSFVVGTAVRTATRAALHHHFQAHAAHGHLGGPFAFRPVHDGETAIFEDRRVGLSHALPGFPHAIPALSGPDEPACDAVIGIAELPISVRYKLDRPAVAAASAGEYAARAAHAYVQNRTGVTHDVIPPRPEQLALWGVESAARAQYPLPKPDAYGADFEELLVLVRGGMAMAITFRYAADAVDWLRLALFRSASRSNLVWTGRPVSADLWPRSTYLERGLWGELNPDRQALAAALGPALRLPDDERQNLSKLLSGMVNRDDPAWYQLPPALLHTQIQALCNATTDGNVIQVVQRGMAEVYTMHDLRGFCVLLGQAVTYGKSTS